MASAAVVFYSGLHLEGKMADLFGKMADRGAHTVAVAECLPADRLIELTGYAGAHDPHVWFDVGLWRRAADCVRDALAELDPANADAYRDRAASYSAELSELDAWVRQRIGQIPEGARVLVTAHDAFSYFGRAYGIEVRGLMGVSTAAEAATSDVQELAEYIAERRVPAIFVESSVSPRYVEALRQAVAARGFDVAIGGSLYSDALGDRDGPAGTYIGTVRANVETIVEALTRQEG
jgi:manganese/zinc/iron transport system substrate-binding protein